MGDETDTPRHPLLAHDQEDALWDAAERANINNEAAYDESLTAQRLFKEHDPEEVLHILSTQAVKKLGSMELEEKAVLKKVGDDSVITMGADSVDIEWQSSWRSYLTGSNPSPPSAPPSVSRQPSPMVGAREGHSGVREETCYPPRRKKEWHAIPVITYVVTIKNAATSGSQGLLQPLLKRYQSGCCSFSVFALPAVQAVIDFKWELFCKKLMLVELCIFLLGLISFYTFTVAFQDEDTTLNFAELLGTTRGKVAVGANFLSVVCMLPFMAIEIQTMKAYGFSGWATIWNLVDMSTYILQLAIVALHVGRFGLNTGVLSVLAAVQCVLLLFRLQYFSRVFASTRFAFVEDLKEVLSDVKWYLAFIVLIILGYSTAFHILFRLDQAKHDEFSTIGKSFVLMVTWAAGNAELGPLYEDSHNPVAACALAISYLFIILMVLLNLLVGIMTNSLNRITENEDVKAFLSKAQIIDELEATIPGWIERRFPDLYPKYIHVLRVDPDKLDTAKLDQLWAHAAGLQGPTVLLQEVAEQGQQQQQGRGDASASHSDTQQPVVASEQHQEVDSNNYSSVDEAVARLERRFDVLQKEMIQEISQLRTMLSPGVQTASK